MSPKAGGTRLGIEAGGGLIQEEHVRITDERASDCQALTLAAGELADTSPGLFLEGYPAEDFLRIRAAPIKAAEERHRLDHEQLFGQLGLLQRDAKALAYGGVIAPPAHPQYLNLASRRFGEAFEYLDGRGFAGTVGSKQPEALTGLDCQVQAADRLDRRSSRISASPGLCNE